MSFLNRILAFVISAFGLRFGKHRIWYWLFHLRIVRNRFARITWHHYLGSYYSQAWKWR
jgi:hypothetical protein